MKEMTSEIEQIIDQNKFYPSLVKAIERHVIKARAEVKHHAEETLIRVNELHNQRVIKASKESYIVGYEKGHNDTVESCYGYQEEKAEDYVAELKKGLK